MWNVGQMDGAGFHFPNLLCRLVCASTNVKSVNPKVACVSFIQGHHHQCLLLLTSIYGPFLPNLHGKKKTIFGPFIGIVCNSHSKFSARIKS